jgi:hypothetical protein
VELVTQFRLREDGKVLSTQTTEFDYVALLEPRSGGIAVEESRVLRSRASETKDSFLLTSGFPALLLMFHPDMRGKFQFHDSPVPEESERTDRIAFRSKPEERSMSALRLKERLYPILWKGFAWIEKGTGNVVRIEASLDSPMVDLGLSELRADVEYKPSDLRDGGVKYQLPSRVTVWVRTPKQQWRNVHEFSGYRLFSVTTSSRRDSSRE